MILIISDAKDTSTDRVINWLNFFKKEFFRINSQDELDIEFVGSDIIFKKKIQIYKIV